MSQASPQPGYFGADDTALFGWLHAADAAGALGLVVCNPFGFEEVCAHRSLRHIAEAASAAGVPSLRFDYPGCGNSQGDEFDAEAAARWVQAVHQAIDALKAASGVRRVALLGVRLGATLAALAAAERDDVAGLVAIAPVVRGRGYIRELTILGQTGAAPASSTHGTLESAGFLMSRETAEFVSRIDLRGLPKAPAPQVLIVQRDDVVTESDWEPVLKRQGAEVRVERWPGYAGMMADPQRAVVPSEIVAGVVAQLQRWSAQAAALGGGEPAGQPLRRQLPLSVAGTPVVELPVQVDTGTGSSLVGVLAMPAAAGVARQRTAVLMLNSGAVHDIGPNRLWVRLARQWAARGLVVLRVDIAGIGDSPARPGAEENVVYSPHALQDVAAALAYLRDQAGADACHLVGLCSGAYHSLKAAVAGHPVASALIINPLTYFWKPGTPLNEVKDYELEELTAKFRGKVFTREPWLKLLRGQLDARLVAGVALRRAWGLVAPQLTEAARVLRIPLRHNLARELESAVAQGVRLQFVFASHAPGYRLLNKQSGRAMQRLLDRQLASIDFVPDADHTFTRLEARERLIAVLDRLMQSAGAFDDAAHGR
jgi:alpha-beta hydrolase superfamily lysophospholipase